MKRNHAAVAAVILGAALLAVFPNRLGSQAADSQSQPATSPLAIKTGEIEEKKTALLNESTDLQALAKSLTGTEFNTALTIDQRAGQGAMELDATIWFIAIYYKMECEPDREVAKIALKNRLGFYSYLLGMQADQVAAHLAFTKLPATAQAGARVKDDLRAAKSKLDEIAASLK